MQPFRAHVLAAVLFMVAAAGCSSARNTVSPPTPVTPAVNATVTGPPEAPMLEVGVPQNWFHLDEQEQNFRGVSTDVAYRTLLQGRQPRRTVVVAVLDSGVDISHEDLQGRIWTNSDEVPGNGVDDDRNGYVDDVHGWNFIGGAGGRSVDHDTYELTREYVRLSEKYEGKAATEISPADGAEFDYYLDVKEAYERTVQEMNATYAQMRGVLQTVQRAESLVKEHLGTETITQEQVESITSPRQDLQEARGILMYLYANGFTPEDIIGQVEYLENSLEYGYNQEFDPRPIVGDDYDDWNERSYGNNDVAGPDPGHGTAVAGVIAAVRGNGIGIEGIADSVRIMTVRTVPNGDERDKDVANAIRYAVDNGAHIINMSFGKGYSPQKNLVDEAVRYAAERGVLLVHAAGNDGEDIDVEPNYPTRVLEDEVWAENWIEVGASSWARDAGTVATFSNFGALEVDVFAPGVDIYTTSPGSSYDASDGTSFAAPVVSGIAALVMSHYPELTAGQVRDILLETAVTYPGMSVTVPGGEGVVDFSTLSATGGIVNAAAALQAAGAVAQ